MIGPDHSPPKDANVHTTSVEIIAGIRLVPLPAVEPDHWYLFDTTAPLLVVPPSEFAALAGGFVVLPEDTAIELVEALPDTEMSAE